MSKFSIFYNLIAKLIKFYIVSLILFLFFRLGILVNFSDKKILSEYKYEVIQSFLLGFRFDTMGILYFFAIILVFILLLFAFSKKFLPKYIKFFNYFSKIYYFICFVIFFWLLLIDFYFFKFFQTHISILFWGIFEDDTKAVLDSVWTDYPIIWIILFFIIYIFFIHKIIKFINKKNPFFKVKNIFLNILFLLVFISVYALGLRGSLGLFPLLKDDASNISDNNFVNSLAINGLFALSDAWVQRRDNTINTDIDGMLKSNGFNNVNEAISKYLDKNINTQNLDSLKLLLWDKTAYNEFLEKNPPNVVFIQMESMSNYYFDLHSKSFNLLGNLEKELHNCIVLRNFLPTGNWTICTLEGIMVNNYLDNITQTIYLNKTFASSCALPFFNSGYETRFLTGGKLAWRNLDKFVKNQYFKYVESSPTIKKNIKNAIDCDWGVYDEYSFEYVLKILKNNTKKPQFIYFMTISNHTPFYLPENYKGQEINVPQSVQKQYRTSKEIAFKNFTAFQYANNCLANFISQIRNSKLGENTIIVATGDHNTLQVFDFYDANYLQKLSVPLIIYIPQKYLPQNKIDSNTFASHKDIFPTIFNISLSNAKYVNAGINLFDTTKAKNNFAFNSTSKIVMNKNGCVDMSSNIFYKWKNIKSKIKELEPVNDKQDKNLLKLYENAKAYYASICFFLQTELLKDKK